MVIIGIAVAGVSYLLQTYSSMEIGPFFVGIFVAVVLGYRSEKASFFLRDFSFICIGFVSSAPLFAFVRASLQLKVGSFSNYLAMFKVMILLGIAILGPVLVVGPLVYFAKNLLRSWEKRNR